MSMDWAALSNDVLDFYSYHNQYSAEFHMHIYRVAMRDLAQIHWFHEV